MGNGTSKMVKSKSGGEYSSIGKIIDSVERREVLDICILSRNGGNQVLSLISAIGQFIKISANLSELSSVSTSSSANSFFAHERNSTL